MAPPETWSPVGDVDRNRAAAISAEHTTGRCDPGRHRWVIFALLERGNDGVGDQLVPGRLQMAEYGGVRVWREQGAEPRGVALPHAAPLRPGVDILDSTCAGMIEQGNHLVELVRPIDDLATG